MRPLKRLAERFARLRRRLGDEREALSFLLESADPQAPLSDRLYWLEQLFGWIRTAPVTQHDFDTASGALHNARLRFMLQLLDRHPDWQARFGATIGSLLKDTSSFHLLCRAGLNRERGFLAEAGERALRRALPQPTEDRDLGDFFVRIFDDVTDAAWVDGLSPTTWGRLVELVSTHSPFAKAIAMRWIDELQAALTALGARVATLGTAPEIVHRTRHSVGKMPFLALSLALNDLGRARDTESVAAARVEARIAIRDCREQVRETFDALEQSGASVSLVYMLENIGACLSRAELLMTWLSTGSENRPAATLHLVATLVRDSVDQLSLRALVRDNVGLVARKIVERTGASGEHYISRTRGEYFSMVIAGLGGGVLMVFTTMVKLNVHAMHLPLLIEGVFFSFNYAASFLLLQVLGFTLATKQPSATAAALAGKLETLEHEGEIREFVDEACRMTRTQLAALVGNLTLLIPFAIGVDWVSMHFFGHHIVDEPTAKSIVQSLHPLQSFTLFNAALTGVLLWLSSIAAGWVENSVVYRDIPRALSTNRRLVRAFGPKWAKRMGDFTLRNASLIGGNVTLGVLMGAVSIAGAFSGLPIDVRHVTLSAASLTFAGSTLVQGGADPTLLDFSVLGVLLVGLINFATAYTLAFLLAARARSLPPQSIARLLRAMRTRLRHRPLDFAFPRERKGAG